MTRGIVGWRVKESLSILFYAQTEPDPPNTPLLKITELKRTLKNDLCRKIASYSPTVLQNKFFQIMYISIYV